MSDTASLITRVKSEGVAQAASELDKLAVSAGKADAAAGKLPKSTEAANKASQNLSVGVRNASYQLQDFIVQVTSGQSALMAFSQQAPQLLGSFGTMGAMVGVVAALTSAVGGPLVKAMTDSRASADEMKEAHETLAKALSQTQSGAYQASDALMTLISSGASAQEQAALLDSAHLAINKTLKDSAQATQEATEATSSWMYGNAIGAKSAMDLGQQTSALAGFLGNLSDKFGISADEAQRLTPLLAAVQKNATPENIKNLAAETARLTASHGNENEALVKLNGTLQQYSTDTRNAQAAQEALKKAQEDATRRINEQNNAVIESLRIGNMADRERIAAQGEADKKAFAQRQNVTKEQIAEYNRQRDEASKQDVAAIDKREKDKADAEAKAAANKAAAEVKRQESQAESQRRAAETFIDGIKRQGADEIAIINETERQKLTNLDKLQQEGALKAGEYENTKTKIMLDADAARQEELAKREEERKKKDQKGEDFMTQIMGQNATELELYDIQQKQKEEIAKSYRDQGLISEEDYQAALVAIAGNYNKKRRTEYSSMLGQTTDDLKTALGEGNKAYKAFAIANAIMNTYQGAVAAFQSAAAIPLVGWIAAPVAAAAAVAAGLANVAKIRSAREQGGSLAAGGIAMVGERNKAELIMPAGASRVRTMEQVQQMMGSQKQNNGSGGVTIVNNTTGRIDSATTETDNEGRLRVIISETVSRALQDSNSDISKSRRTTRGQPGF